MKFSSRAVRGVYRCIVRHLNHLDPSLIKNVRKQFQRRVSYAKIGHIRAAYNFESQLRQVVLGNLTLQQVKQNFTKIPVDTMEVNAKNAHDRHMLDQKNRRLDQYNAPPQAGSLEAVKVQNLAGMYNSRKNYIRRFLKGSSPSELDVTIIDTILGPQFDRLKQSRKLRGRKERLKHPRKVQLATFTRAGIEVGVIRVQGLKPHMKGFRQHLSRMDVKNTKRLLRLSEISKLLEQKPRPANITELQKERLALTRAKEKVEGIYSIKKRIMEVRAARLQRYWNRQFKIKQQQRGL